MAVYQSSFLGEEEESEQVAGFQKILDIMIDPAIDMCTSENEEKRRLRPRWDQPVYVLNCLSYLEVRSLHLTFSILLNAITEYPGAIFIYSGKARLYTQCG